MTRTALTRLSAAALLALAACSGGDEDVSIDSFTANPLVVTAGGTTMLSWKTTNATGITITANPGGEVVSSADASGSATSAALNADTVFTLTAQGTGGPVTKTVSVTVQADNDAPMITSFMAMPNTIVAGGMSTLSWTTMNADSVSITAGGVSIVDSGPASGNEVVMPADTTTYTLVATGAGGTAMGTVTVTVTLDPIINTFAASPNPIDAGDSSTLSWDVTNADTVTVEDSGGTELYNDTDLTGSITVMPAMTETYTLTARNSNGMATRTTMLTVNQPQGPSITAFDASPTTVDLGQPVTLSWTVADANTITITDGAGTATTTSDLTGSWVVYPIADTTYTLTASDGTNPDAMATAMVTVNAAAPAILSFTATPNPAALNGQSTLAFQTVGADDVRILRGNTEIYSGTLNTDTVVVTLTETSTTFTLEATNTTGTNTGMVVVYAQAAPTIDTFTVAPQTFIGTTTATLTWDVTSTRLLELYVNGTLDTGFTGVGTGTAAVNANGTYSVAINATTTFRLVATSAGGTAEATVSSTLLIVESEPNDDVANANPVTGPLVGISGTISVDTDVDIYAITVQDGDSLRIETTDGAGGCTMDTEITLTSTDGVTVLAIDDEDGNDLNDGSTVGVCSLINPLDPDDVGATNLAAGTYFIDVHSWDNDSTGSYVLEIEVIPAACGNSIPNPGEICDDGNTVAGDGCNAACMLEVTAVYTAPGAPMTYTGTIATNGQYFTYQIDATAETYIRAETFSNASLDDCSWDSGLVLVDSQGTVLGSDDADGINSCSQLDPARDAWLRVPAGTYYLVVFEDGSDATASFHLQIEGPAVDICGNGVVDGTDQCDDGNLLPGDGCNATCQIEAVGTFVATPGATQTFAGNALAVGQVDTYIVDVPSGGADVYVMIETFGDAQAGTCGIDTQLFVRDMAGTELAYDDDDGVGACSVLVPGVDAGVLLAAGSSSFVAIQEYQADDPIANYDVVFTAVAANVCGNGVTETGEDCDDGNTAGGDSCPASCQFSALLNASATPNLAIPDDDTAGVTTTLTLPATPACTMVTVLVDIDVTHTYRGDLDIQLTSPAGTTVQLWAPAFDSTDDIVGTFPTTLTPASPLTPFTGEAGNGVWTLYLEDTYADDTGTLNGWGITAACQ